VARYSFLVGLFHSLLHAGLARRTEITMCQHAQLLMTLRLEQIPGEGRTTMGGGDNGYDTRDR